VHVCLASYIQFAFQIRNFLLRNSLFKKTSFCMFRLPSKCMGLFLIMFSRVCRLPFKSFFLGFFGSSWIRQRQTYSLWIRKRQTFSHTYIHTHTHHTHTCSSWIRTRLSQKHTRAHTHTHTRTYTHTHTHTRAHTHTHTYTCRHTHTHTRTRNTWIWRRREAHSLLHTHTLPRTNTHTCTCNC